MRAQAANFGDTVKARLERGKPAARLLAQGLRPRAQLFIFDHVEHGEAAYDLGVSGARRGVGGLIGAHAQDKSIAKEEANA